MSFKATYILFAVFVAMLGLFGLTLLVKKPGSDAAGYVFPTFHEEKKPVATSDVDSVEIERKGREPLVMVKRGQEWYRQKPRMRLQASEVNVLLREVADARRNEDAEVTSNLKQWGLDEPALVVILRRGGAKEWKLSVGRQSPENDGVVYVASSDRPGEVLAVKRSEVGALVNFKFDKFWSRRLLEASTISTQVLTISDRRAVKSGKTITLKRTASGSYTFTVPPYGPAEMEGDVVPVAGRQEQTTGVRGLLQAIDGLQADGHEPFERRPNLKDFGLQEDAPGLRITVENTGGPPGEAREGTRKETLLVGKKVRGKDQYYARLLSEQVVFLVPGKGLEPILKVIQDDGRQLRSRRLTQIEPSMPDAVTIEHGGQVIELRRAGFTDWKLKSATTGVRKAQDLEIQGLLSALKADHEIKEFEDKRTDAELGLDKPTAVVSVWVGGVEPKEEKKDEKKDKDQGKKKGDKKETKPADDFPVLRRDAAKKPTLKLTFGKTAKDLVYVKREAEGEVNRVAVPVALFKTVDRGPLAYLNRNLTPFRSTDVTRLLIDRGGRSIEVERDDKRATWNVVKPKVESANKAADLGNVTTLLGKLARLSVLKWVKVKPDEKDLKDYDLAKPPLTVRVTVKNADPKLKPETRTFEFGKEVEYEKGHKGVYAREKGSDLVFLADPALVHDLRDTELRDRTVLPFDTSTVTGVKIEGWNDPAKHDFTLKLELTRKGAGQPWQVAPNGAPGGFKFDEEKVQPFLDLLAGLRLQRFVPGGVKKEYGLDKDQRILFVELTLEGRKKPYTLTIGKAKGKDEGYYAESSALGNEVFLLPQGELSALLGTPPWISYFKKSE